MKLSTKLRMVSSNRVSYLNELLIDEPLGLWMMNETSGTVMNDFSGYNRHGSYTGSVTHNAIGPSSSVPSAMLFNASLGRGVTPSFDLSSTTIVTLEFWLKISSWLQPRTLVAFGDAEYRGFEIHTYTPPNMDVILSIPPNGGMSYRTFASVSQSLDWEFWSVVISRDEVDSLCSLRRNNVEVSMNKIGLWSGSSVGFLSDAAFSFAAKYGGSQQMPCAMAGVALYGTRLSDERREAHFLASSP